MIKRGKCLFGILMVLSMAAIPAVASSDAFLMLAQHGLLQLWWPDEGWLVNVDLNREFNLTSPVPFECVAASDENIYLLDRRGRIFSLLDRALVCESMFGGADGKDLQIGAGTDKLWILDSLGRLFPCQLGEGSGLPAFYNLSAGDPCAVGQDNQGRLWMISTEGILQSIPDGKTHFPAENMQAPLIDFEFNPSKAGGLALDRSGRLYEWGPPMSDNPPKRPEFGHSVAQDLEFSPQFPDVYYILDRHGSVFSSSGEKVLSIPEPYGDYQSLAVMSAEWLASLWKENYPKISVYIDPPEMRIPYWRPGLKFTLKCDQAWDLTDFSCLIEFNPKTLLPRQIFQGELFQPTRGRGIIMDDSRFEEGILTVRGVSADRRSGSGMTGSGSLFEIEMGIRQPGSSSLRILEFNAVSPSLPTGSVPQAGVNHSQVSVFYAEPSIGLNLDTIPEISLDEQDTVPRMYGKVTQDTRFSVYLQVNHVKGMKGLRYSLSFDSDMLQLLAVEERAFLRRQGPTLLLADPVESASPTGQLEDQGLVILGRGPGASGPGELVRYLFKGGRPGKAVIRLDRAVLVDEQRRRVPLQISSAEVDVEIIRPR